MKFQKFILFIAVLVSLSLPSVTHADGQTERIVSFDSHITVNEDSHLDVRETVVVNALNQTINHGIYRDFPTEYKTNSGLNVHVHFTVTDVQRDGTAEDYTLESIDGGKRIKIGNADTIIPVGDHTYNIAYTVDRELGYFSDHDELYWNVTGNGWLFPIDKASATVTLPTGMPASTIVPTFFTGPTGSKDHFATAVLTDGHKVHFETTQPLSTQEGLTVVVAWPKGFVEPPSSTQLRLWLIQDNLATILAALFALLIAAYYLWRWSKVGRDAAKVTIIPEYEPPAGFTPGMLRYLIRGTNISGDFHPLAATIVSLAIKGLIKIEDAPKPTSLLGKIFSSDKLRGKYQLVKTNRAPDTNLAADELALYTKLSTILTTHDPFVLNEGNRTSIMAINAAQKSALARSVGADYYKANGAEIGMGILLSVLGIFGIVGAASNSFSVWAGLLVALIVVINGIFIVLLPRFTQLGQETLAKIRGFKWFLEVTEKDRLNFHNPPEKTPELFEKFLPYAIALGVENKWADQFTDVLKAADYHPNWYGGTWAYVNYASFASDFGSGLTNTLQTAGTPPGSSSGSSGSSGGGGGGGGGGGW